MKNTLFKFLWSCPLSAVGLNMNCLLIIMIRLCICQRKMPFDIKEGKNCKLPSTFLLFRHFSGWGWWFREKIPTRIFDLKFFGKLQGFCGKVCEYYGLGPMFCIWIPRSVDLMEFTSLRENVCLCCVFLRRGFQSYVQPFTQGSFLQGWTLFEEWDTSLST